MKIGTIVSSLSAKESIERAVLAEGLGYDSFWLCDHFTDLSPGRCVDPWPTMGGIAVQTKKLVVGTSVTDPIRTHPAKTAQTLLTLNEISDGRVILGIGAGEAMNILPYGLPFGPPEERAGRLEEAVQLIKLLWAARREKPVSFSGRYYKLDRAWLDQVAKKPPRLFVGVFGARRTLEIVGKYADGWLPWINTPETYAERVGRIKDASRRAGRDPESLEYVVPMYTHMGADRKSMREMIDMTKRVILIEGHTGRKRGFAPPRDLVETYQTTLVGEKTNRALKELQDSVPDELALEFLTFGSPREWIERMERFRQAGATHVIAQLLDQSERSMKTFASDILPRINRKD